MRISNWVDLPGMGKEDTGCTQSKDAEVKFGVELPLQSTILPPPHSCTPVVEPLEGERGENTFLSKSFHVSHPANVSRSALSFEIIVVFEISAETRRVRRFDRKQ